MPILMSVIRINASIPKKKKMPV